MAWRPAGFQRQPPLVFEFGPSTPARRERLDRFALDLAIPQPQFEIRRVRSEPNSGRAEDARAAACDVRLPEDRPRLVKDMVAVDAAHGFDRPPETRGLFPGAEARAPAGKFRR